ncbi:MAG: FKBP-type peptidyl-prolyl cis-trans isomerase [Terriglobales bacterium]
MQKSFTTLASTTVAVIMLLGNVLAQTPPATTQQTPAAASQTSSALKTEKDKVSYAIGMNIGTTLHRQSVDVDPKILQQGLEDAMAGGKTLLSEAEARATLNEFQADMRKKMQEKMQAEGEANKKEGDAFLAANKAKEGVVTLPSGLQYKILTPGTGPKPTATDSVICNYRGTLIDGKEFDSSYKRGQPATFPVSGVIKGWTEALQLMPVGSKWQLVVPSDLAYGERGQGPDIAPNATLIFEVELLSIKSKDEGQKKDSK